ncbi:MAG: helix-turn-helix transcriptional regulator [Mogibacterium sp.]|nr:helix-turn-helix transcriptional regulator [Mogibacterium sp.]
MMKKENTLKTNKEKARHGDIFLPVNSYHCLIPFTYRELALHWHEEMEITLIQDGTSDYKVGQKVFEANAGDIILIPPYCTHSACEIPGKTMISDSMVFHPDYLGANNQDLSASKYLRPMAEGQLLMQEVIRDGDEGYAEIKDTFIRALDCFKNKQPFYEMLLKEKLLHILILLFSYGYIRESDDSHITSENRRHIKSALEYITDHYSEKLSISEMAQLAGFSENYFMSLFRQYVGMSCIQYVNHYRIQKAAHALEETTKSVSEIAMIHGFDNISYFNLQFRRTFGMTPREFRSKRK